jgi:thiosulfate/3-mercaptopyruvate sulfurtransferase
MHSNLLQGAYMKMLFSLLFVTLSLFANQPLVSAKWLHENLDKSNLRLIHVSSEESFSLEHIPHAMQTDIGAFRVAKDSYLLLRPANEIQTLIQKLGIDASSQVVLYAPITTPKDLLKTSYIYWALNYYGITNVALLDGGLDAYKSAGYDLSDKVTKVAKSSYKVSANKAIVADKAYVLEHLHKLPMIDARPADKYLGITPTATVKRDGHIAGAMSYSWNFSIDAEYKLKDKAALDALFKDGYGLDKNKEVLVYCTGGLETSFNYFVLHGLLGYKNVRLYDASMKEWGNSEDTPMVQYKYENFGK